MKIRYHITRRITAASVFFMVVLSINTVFGQQFSSDNYLSKPHGMSTIILTVGQRNTMFMSTFSLIQRWEFTAAAYIYKTDKDKLTNDGYSLSYYAKYMIYENEWKTGGIAVKAGKGLDPGYQDGDEKVNDASQTWWTNAPVTLPLFNNRLSWDIMPGASFTENYGTDKKIAKAFTYTTRLAYYPFDPLWGIVAEIFGSKGQVSSHPEYRAGLRWEPSQYANFALTYGAKMDGTPGAGWEIGMMLFTPPFACIGGCH